VWGGGMGVFVCVCVCVVGFGCGCWVHYVACCNKCMHYHNTHVVQGVQVTTEVGQPYITYRVIGTQSLQL
jgi:hypothetical protein